MPPRSKPPYAVIAHTEHCAKLLLKYIKGEVTRVGTCGNTRRISKYRAILDVILAPPYYITFLEEVRKEMIGSGLYGGSKTKHVTTFRVSKEVRRKAEEVARKCGVSLAMLAKIALLMMLENGWPVEKDLGKGMEVIAIRVDKWIEDVVSKVKRRGRAGRMAAMLRSALTRMLETVGDDCKTIQEYAEKVRELSVKEG